MGFIKIHRNIREWGWYDDANTFVVWVHLLIDANYEERTWHGETVGVGSMITSTAKLAEDVGLSVKQVRTCLERLVKDGKIVVKGASKWTKITVCNYDSYMLEGEDAGQTRGKQRANKRQAEGEQRATLKEDKNVRTEEDEEKEKKVSNDTKEKFLESAKRVYDAYPATTIRGGKVKHTRSSKDIDRIISVLKKGQYTEEKLISIIKKYEEETQGEYMRNLEFFLNNIPDYSEAELNLFAEEDGSEDWIDGRRPQRA